MTAAEVKLVGRLLVLQSGSSFEMDIRTLRKSLRSTTMKCTVLYKVYLS